MAADQVSDAFDLLVDEIGLVLGTLGGEIADAGAAKDFGRAEVLVATAQAVEALSRDVAVLESRWQEINPEPVHGIDAETDDGGDGDGGHGPRRFLGRVGRGERTPEDAFYRPILEVLVQRGGSGSLREVLDDIEPMLSGSFTDADLATLPSDERQLRWRNTAQWARNTLVSRGLMKRPRKRGVWEISDEGRRWLTDQKGQR